MTIQLNGNTHAVEGEPTLAQLVAALGYTSGFAVAVNGEFVPRSGYADHHLAEGDAVEVLTARAGG